MARLTKADAARQLGISRTTLYKLIDQGRVSATPEGLIDDTALVRAAPYVDLLKERSRTSMDNTDMDMNPRHDEHRERPPEPVHEHSWTGVHERQWPSTNPLVQTVPSLPLLWWGVRATLPCKPKLSEKLRCETEKAAPRAWPIRT
jgi:transposase-like protein